MTSARPTVATGPAPGALVLVVGPSGSGKDSLIRFVRDRLAADERFVFPRRVVTRPASESEDNVEADPASFETMAGGGHFLASWSAHGLRYGLPASIATDLAAGRTVICNVSRTSIADLRDRVPRVVVVEITAPAATLAQRLAERGRVADGDLGARLARTGPGGAVGVDVSIHNDGPLDRAGTRFLDVLRAIARPRRPSPSALEARAPG